QELRSVVWRALRPGNRRGRRGGGTTQRRIGPPERPGDDRRDAGRGGRCLSVFAGPIQALIDELARLPGIGPKSAQRLAFWLVKAPPDDAKRLASAIVQAKDRISFCRECGSVAEGDLCRICRDESRDRTVL